MTTRPGTSSLGWLEELEEELAALFPKHYFEALRRTVENVTNPIDGDLEDEMRLANKRGRHVLDAAAQAEIVHSRLKKSKKILSGRLATKARESMKGRPTKDEVEAHILGANDQYSTLVTRVDLLEVLLGFLRGDSYGKGGLKEQVRFRKDMVQELSVRERRGMEDDALVD